MSFDTRSAAFAYLRTYYSAAALDREDTFLLDATIDGIEHARRVAVAAGQSLRCLELGCGPVAAWALCPGAVAGELWLAERSQGGRQVLHEWLTGDREAFDWSVYAAHVAKRMVELGEARESHPAVPLCGADDAGVSSPSRAHAEPGSGAPSSAAVDTFADEGSAASVSPGISEGSHAAGSCGASSGSRSRPLTAADVLASTRASVVGLLDCDLRRTPVLTRAEGGAARAGSGSSPPSSFHAVVMHSVADAISGTPEEFAALVSSAARLVAPRGSLLISVNTEVDEWHAEAVAFPQVRLSCDQVLAAIEGAGLQAVFSRQRSRLPDGKDTETAHTMVVLADKPPRAE